MESGVSAVRCPSRHGMEGGVSAVECPSRHGMVEVGQTAKPVLCKAKALLQSLEKQLDT